MCKTEPYFEVKLVTKCEQHATETLIENYLVKEKSFYCLIERSVSNITGDIFFFQQSLGNAVDNKHLASNLPTHAKHRPFP